MDEAVDNATPLRVLIIGTGALGSLYGAMLARAGADVSAVCRSAHAVAASTGLRIRSIWGDMTLRPRQVLRGAREYQGRADILLVALKVHPEIPVVELLRPAVKPGTHIVLLQNGVEIEAAIASAFPRNPVISALAFVCCNRLGDGYFHHLDYGRLTLGSWPGGISPMVRRLASDWEQAGVPVTITEDIVQARWKKLVWNAPFNPLSVLTGGRTTREILDDPASAELTRRVMEEVCAIAAAAGHPLPPTVVDEMLADTQAMKPYKTSMLLDHEAGRPMEVEAILGNALRAAERGNVPAPHLRTLYALMRHLERRNSAQA